MKLTIAAVLLLVFSGVVRAQSAEPVRQHRRVTPSWRLLRLQPNRRRLSLPINKRRFISIVLNDSKDMRLSLRYSSTTPRPVTCTTVTA